MSHILVRFNVDESVSFCIFNILEGVSGDIERRCAAEGILTRYGVIGDSPIRLRVIRIDCLIGQRERRRPGEAPAVSLQPSVGYSVLLLFFSDTAH